MYARCDKQRNERLFTEVKGGWKPIKIGQVCPKIVHHSLATIANESHAAIVIIIALVWNIGPLVC
jgi:hypothetical protein